MGDGDKGVIHAATDGGVSGEHSEADPFEFFVGPSTADQFNSAHLRLIPIACWRVDDVRFAFDSSFVDADPTSDNPNDIRTELAHLLELVRLHPGAPLSVFGHADPVGNDDYNKLLSGRRAMAIYAVLVAHGEPDRAVKLWTYISGKEHWGKQQRDTMRSFTGLPRGTPDSILFQTYLKKLSPPELTLKKEDFLGQGVDSGGKGDFQGCSEFNPVLIFSKEEQDKSDQAQRRNREEDQGIIAGRNAANAPNRRVMVLMFRKGSKVDPAKWPCPRATEGVAGCKKRFWSDGERRRNTHIPDEERRFEDGDDTFACRFYERQLSESPCEHYLPTIIIRLYDPDGKFIANAPYLLAIGVGSTPKSGTADSFGFLRLLHLPVPSTCIVQWGYPQQSSTQPVDYIFRLEVCLDVGIGSNDEFLERLNNLGYDREDPAEGNTAAFQRTYGKPRGLRTDGVLDDATAGAIREVHDACADQLGHAEET